MCKIQTATCQVTGHVSQGVRAVAARAQHVRSHCVMVPCGLVGSARSRSVPRYAYKIRTATCQVTGHVTQGVRAVAARAQHVRSHRLMLTVGKRASDCDIQTAHLPLHFPCHR
jgi:hypothetical protein